MNNPQAVLSELKKLGFEVTVTHKRLTYDEFYRMTAMGWEHMSNTTRKATLDLFSTPKDKLDPGVVFPRGGMTIVKVEAPRGTREARFVYTGVAYCSAADNFDRRVGLVKATGRLVSSLRMAGLEVGRTFKTKSGKVLTDDDIQKLADEAEKGYVIQPRGEGDDPGRQSPAA